MDEPAPVAMAMFPLGTVLFPYALLPLHVFEPRYRLMMRHVLDGDREFGVVLIERGSEVGGGDTRFDVATVARVVQASELPDGRYALATVGMRRVRITEWLPDDPYPRAEVVPLDDPAPTATATAIAARSSAIDAFAAATELARRIDPRITDPPEFDPDPVRASFEMGAVSPVGLLDAQRLLAAPDAPTRLELIATLLDEHGQELRARFGLDD